MDNDPSSGTRHSFNSQLFLSRSGEWRVRRNIRGRKREGENGWIAKAKKNPPARTTTVRSPGSRPSDKARRWCHRGQGEKGITRERTEDTEDEQLAVETSLPGIKFPVEVVARALERLQTRGEFRPHPFPVDCTAPPNYRLALSTSLSLPNIQRQVALHGRWLFPV